MNDESRNIFIKGSVSPEFIAREVASLVARHDIGAHSIFLGQVRADLHEGRPVVAIRYTAYENMAIEKAAEICAELIVAFDLAEIRIWHSLGEVQSGEISLFVLTAARHRRAALDSCSEAVERLKKELPVWGQELHSDNYLSWKENS
jgi:molybdopterin synthase catalytic subunit